MVFVKLFEHARQNSNSRWRLLTVLLFCVVCFFATVVATSEMAQGATTSQIRGVINDSTSSGVVQLQITSIDDSELSSHGRYVVRVRVFGTTQVTALVNGQVVSTQPSQDDGLWHEHLFALILDKAGEYTITFRASSSAATEVAEEIVDVAYVPEMEDSGEEAGGIGQLLPPNTGVLRVGTFEMSLPIAWWLLRLLPLAVIGLLFAISQRRCNSDAGKISKSS